MKKYIINTYEDFLESKYAFFIMNLSGWFVYWCFRQAMIISMFDSKTRLLINTSILVFSGFLTTFSLRYFYKKINVTSLSDIKLWLLIFLLAIVHSIIWFFVDFLIYSQTMATFEELFEWLNVRIFIQQVALNSFVLLVWSFLYFMIKIRHSWKQLSERKMRAELYAKDLEIKMLRYQLNPHFLFNSLNSIRALTLKDINRSREMISELSEFLRYTLLNKNTTKIKLGQEIDAVKHFCTIEKIRFQEKLDINFSIAAETEPINIPTFILHPLVENAIKFGMETSGQKLFIKINSFLEEEYLVLEISNTGNWIDEKTRINYPVAGTKTGLENVKQILSSTYPERHIFEINGEDNLVTIRIKIKREKN